MHLSRVRAGRQNLEGEGSNLFWELVRILELAEKVFSPMVAVEYVVENVASRDTSARDEISRTLDIEPVMVCPSDCLPFNPRLAWISKMVVPTSGVQIEQREGFKRIHMQAEPLDDVAWMDDGWRRVDREPPLPIHP